MSDNSNTKGIITEKYLRNIGIVAHVDHGKTTLADTIFAQTQTNVKFTTNKFGEENDRALDSNDLEHERGITILSKVSAVNYKNYRLNVMDTPGHADFAAEVERMLSMLDGILLVIDAVEGVKPQTRFVIRKALAKGCKIIIFVNKIDKLHKDEAASIISNTEGTVLDYLFDQTGDESIFDIPILYGSGRDGYASRDLQKALDGKISDISELLDAIIEFTPEPKKMDTAARLLTTVISYDQHLGRQLIGRIYGNGLKIGKGVLIKNQEGKVLEKLKINKMVRYLGTDNSYIDEAGNGDIVGLYTNCNIASVNDTVMLEDLDPIPSVKIDPPILSVTIGPNKIDQGQDGKHVTATAIINRIRKEIESNVGIKAEFKGSEVVLHGRGELQLSVLFETMRREGYEFTISSASINLQEDANGNKTEPIETVNIEAPLTCMGIIMDGMQLRHGKLITMDQSETVVKMTFEISSRNLMGYVSIFNTQTKGAGILSREITKFEPINEAKAIKRSNGSMIASHDGIATGYAINKLLARGKFFIEPGDKIYKGQLVGEANTSGQLHINVVKSKKLTNMRASGTDEAIRVPPSDKKTLEQYIVYIQSGEYLRVTPSHIQVIVKT